jgi:hypothetical protein
MACTGAATTPDRRAILPAQRTADTRSGRIGRAVRRLSIPLAFVAPALLTVLHPEQAAAQSQACSRTTTTVVVIVETRDGPVMAHARVDAAENGCWARHDDPQLRSGDDASVSGAFGAISASAVLCAGPGPIIKLKQHIDCPVIGYAVSGIAIEAAGGRNANRVHADDARRSGWAGPDRSYGFLGRVGWLRHTKARSSVHSAASRSAGRRNP